MPYGIQHIQQHCTYAVKELIVLLLFCMKYEYPTKIVGFIDLCKLVFVKVLSMCEITIVCFIWLLPFLMHPATPIKENLPEAFCFSYIAVKTKKLIRYNQMSFVMLSNCISCISDLSFPTFMFGMELAPFLLIQNF